MSAEEIDLSDLCRRCNQPKNRHELWTLHTHYGHDTYPACPGTCGRDAFEAPSTAPLELMSCDCDCEPDCPEDNEPPYLYLRTCERCGTQWGGLHCPHDGVQNPCPGCGLRPEVMRRAVG